MTHRATKFRGGTSVNRDTATIQFWCDLRNVLNGLVGNIQSKSESDLTPSKVMTALRNMSSAALI